MNEQLEDHRRPRQSLGLPGTEPNAASVTVLVEFGDQVAGLLVDALCEIFTATDEIRPIP
jgi:chemotaxis signal transduction protein